MKLAKFDIVNFEHPNSKCGLAYLAVLGYSGSGDNCGKHMHKVNCIDPGRYVITLRESRVHDDKAGRS